MKTDLPFRRQSLKNDIDQFFQIKLIHFHMNTHPSLPSGIILPLTTKGSDILTCPRLRRLPYCHDIFRFRLALIHAHVGDISDGIVHIHATTAAGYGGRNHGIIARTHVPDCGAEVLEMFFRECGGAGRVANTTGASVETGESGFDHLGSIGCRSVIGDVGGSAVEKGGVVVGS